MGHGFGLGVQYPFRTLIYAVDVDQQQRKRKDQYGQNRTADHNGQCAFPAQTSFFVW